MSYGWGRVWLATSITPTGGHFVWKENFHSFPGLFHWKNENLWHSYLIMQLHSAKRKRKITGQDTLTQFQTGTHYHTYSPAGQRTCCNVWKWFLCCHRSRTLWWCKPERAKRITTFELTNNYWWTHDNLYPLGHHSWLIVPVTGSYVTLTEWACEKANSLLVRLPRQESLSSSVHMNTTGISDYFTSHLIYITSC